jgi:hypothetical protein
MLGDPVRADPLATSIDRIAEHAAATLATGVRRARMWVREQDPLARLGLDIVEGAHRRMRESRMQEALARVPEVVTGEWWLAPAVHVQAGGADVVHVVAADGRLAAVSRSARVARSEIEAALRPSAQADAFELLGIATVDGEAPAPRWGRDVGGNPVIIVSVADVAQVIEQELERSGPYDPERDSGLSRLLHGARIAERQRETALTLLASGLDPEQWVVAPAVPVAGLARAIDVIAIGPSGIYVCAVAGLEPERAALWAATGARAVAGRGLSADVIPAVLFDPGRRAHQLELADGRRVWALAAEEAASRMQATGRQGPPVRRIRRVRRPAPGWEYRIATTADGLVYEVHYDTARHDRSVARRR